MSLPVSERCRSLGVFTVALVAGGLAAGAALASPVGHWRFDETSGTTASDSAGAFHGTLEGAASFVPGGVAGGAVSFNSATGDRVNMGNVLGFTAGDFSLSAWVNTTTTFGSSMIVSKHHSGTQNGYFLAISHSQTGKATFYHSGGDATSTTTVNDGSWHHVAGVYRSGGTAEIFVDGAPAEATSAAVPIAGNGVDLIVGGFAWFDGAPTGWFNGLIDDVQVYDRALTASEVAFLHQNPGAEVNAVPVPAPVVLLGTGLAAVLGLRRRPTG